MFDLESDDITGHYWAGLNKMIPAFSYGEPFSQVMIGATVGAWLLDKGLVEQVTERPWPSKQPCYRLSDLGHSVLKRGRYAKGPPKRPKLKMVEPRIKPLRPLLRTLGNDDDRS
jgi:hypothetical protein